MSKLLRAEQHLLEQQQQQEQQQQDELPPVLAAVLEYVDIIRFASPMGTLTASPGNFYQSCMEFWPSLIQTRAAYKALKQQHPQVFRCMLDNTAHGIVLVAPEALAVNLQTLYQVYRHGGVDVLCKELRPILIKYPEDFPEAAAGSGLAGTSDTQDLSKLKPGEDMLNQALFLSCMMDAAEHDKDTLQLDTCTIKMWRSSVLLLRAIWDAIPELRRLYADFMQRLADLEGKRFRTKDGQILCCVCHRIAMYNFCLELNHPFMEQQQWMAVVKKDPDGFADLHAYAVNVLGVPAGLLPNANFMRPRSGGRR